MTYSKLAFALLCFAVPLQASDAPALTNVAPPSASIAPAPVNDSNQNLYTQLDANGLLTPALKEALRKLVARQDDLTALNKKVEEAQFEVPVQDNKYKITQEEVKQLQSQLDDLLNQPKTQFEALQKIAADPKANLDDQIKAANAYVWGWPQGTYLPQAQQILNQLLLAKQAQVAQEQKNAADREAHRQTLLAGAQAKKLNLTDWQEFLQNLTKDDVTKYLGNPNRGDSDYWYYDGSWVKDPQTGKETGLVLYFSGRRVIKTSPAPAQDIISAPPTSSSIHTD